MRAVVQRVAQASVTVEGTQKAAIGAGVLVFLGIMREDDEKDVAHLVHKLVHFRIFDDEQGVMNLDIRAVKGEILVISQFTLCARTKKGHRPSYAEAAPPEPARVLYEDFLKRLSPYALAVKSGVFGRHMDVGLVNDGPVTFFLDTRSP